MIKQLRANTAVNLKFYRRSRFLVLVSIFLLLIMSLSVLPYIFMGSTTKMFNIVKSCVVLCNQFLVLFSALLGMITVWYHQKNRSVKMVFTKPCSTGNWLLSHFLSALIVISLFAVIMLGITSVLFLFSGGPIPSGLPFVLLFSVLRSMIVFSFLLCLSSFIHPVVAGMLSLFFMPATLLQSLEMVLAQLRSEHGSLVELMLHSLKYIISGIYLILPVYSPFGNELSPMMDTYRLNEGDIYCFFVTFIYTIMFCALSFIIVDYTLKKKRMI